MAYSYISGTGLDTQKANPEVSTLENLKSELKGGLRKNKFKIEFNFYNGTNEFTTLFANGDLNRMLNVLSRDVVMPDRTINTVDYWHFGRRYVERAETQYQQSVDITFVDDSEMTVRRLMDNWMYAIENTIQTGVDGALGKSVMIDDYQCDLVIMQLDTFGNPVYGYKLTHAFPSVIGNIAYSQSSENELVEFNVTFTYSECVPYEEK